MTIADIAKRSKIAIALIPPHVVTVGILLLSTTLAFGLGILAGKDMGMGQGSTDKPWIEDRSPSLMESVRTASSSLPAAAILPVSGTPGVGYVASKSGTKYYLPSCSGVARIKESNKVWFADTAEAESAGYTPASNCPGL